MLFSFEFDPAKSDANLAKHGIDFLTAQLLWNDPKPWNGLAQDRGERREYLIGVLEGRLWAAVFVRRADKIRLISVRRARNKEVQDYEQAKR